MSEAVPHVATCPTCGHVRINLSGPPPGRTRPTPEPEGLVTDDRGVTRQAHRETETEPTKQREGDQILPTASRDLPVAHDAVIADLQERLRLGIQRYGQGLRPFNGRNTLQDMYDEIIDQAVYAKTLVLMQQATRAILVEQVASELEPLLAPMFIGHTNDLVSVEIAEKVVTRILDCFTGQLAHAG